MDTGVWRATVHRVIKSRTRLKRQHARTSINSSSFLIGHPRTSINSFYFSIGRPGLCACGLSPGAACPGFLSSYVPGSSWWWCLSLRSTSSRCKGFRICGFRLSSRGEWAELPHSRWNLPGPAIEPVSLAMAGGFLTTGQPGKSLYLSIYHLSSF